LDSASGEKEEITGLDSSEKDKDEFTEEEVKRFWNQYLEELKSLQPVLFNVLNTTTCLVRENYTIFFEFPSNSAYDEFENLREDIFQKLKKHVNNYSISFEYEIKETQRAILLSSKDKFEKMVKVNPLLEKLRNDFRLDI
jgi:DNA polymerase III alpha subunit (gram-positive type)